MDILTPFIPIVVFFAVLQFANAFHLKPIVSAAFAVGIPQLFSMYREFILSGSELLGVQLLSIGGVLTVILQLCVAFFVFSKQDRLEESLIQWIIFVVIGAFAIYYLVPGVLKPLF